MKKRNVILCAGALSMAMLCGCGAKDAGSAAPEATQEVVEATAEAVQEEAEVTAEPVQEEVAAEVTAEPVQEETANTEATIDVEFASILLEIYGLQADSSNVDQVAERFANFAIANGAPSTSSVFEDMAASWFASMQDSEGKDIRSEFATSFDLVNTTALKNNAELEFDLNYTNVYSGINMAIEE